MNSTGWSGAGTFIAIIALVYAVILILMPICVYEIMRHSRKTTKLLEELIEAIDHYWSSDDHPEDEIVPSSTDRPCRKYRVVGIDTESGLQTSQVVLADSQRNAILAAKSQGIETTGVEPV